MTLFNVPGSPVKSNCDTPTEKASEFLDHHLKPVMQGSWSYIKDSVDFLRKIKQIGNLPENSILVTADVAGLYPSIPHELDLKALEKALKKESQSRSLLNILLSWLNLCSKIITLNLMEKLNNRVKERLLELSLHHHMRAYPWISLNLNFWKHIFDDFNKFHPNLRFTYEYSRKNVTFLGLNAKFIDLKIFTDLHIKATDRHQYLHYTSSHSYHTKR